MAPTEGGGRVRKAAPIPENIDIGKVLLEARSRWLKPVEVCDILRNFENYEFQLNQEPPVKPPSGSLYLFDRKAVRYFRKDGHVWRKKKDGKTVREAHEKLKAGSIDILHCYYAHAERDYRFQRRCYWMLDGTNENIVLVHYREVQQGTGRAQVSPHGSPPQSPQQIGSPAERQLAGNSKTPALQVAASNTSQWDPAIGLSDHSEASNYSSTPAKQFQIVPEKTPPDSDEYESDGNDANNWDTAGITSYQIQGRSDHLGGLLQQQQVMAGLDSGAGSMSGYLGGQGSRRLLENDTNVVGISSGYITGQLTGPNEESWQGQNQVDSLSSQQQQGASTGYRTSEWPSTHRNISEALAVDESSRHQVLEGLRNKPRGLLQPFDGQTGLSGPAVDFLPELGSLDMAPWMPLVDANASGSHVSADALTPAKLEDYSSTWAVPQPLDLVSAQVSVHNRIENMEGMLQAQGGRQVAQLGEADNEGIHMELDRSGSNKSNTLLQLAEQTGHNVPQQQAQLQQAYMQGMGLDVQALGEDAIWGPTHDGTESNSIIQRPAILEEIFEEGEVDLGQTVRSGTQADFPSFPKLHSFSQWTDGYELEQPMPTPSAATSSDTFHERGSMDFDASTMPLNRPEFSIVDIAPLFCSPLGGTKVLIVGSMGQTPPGHAWGCLFGNTEVVAEVVQEGVLRCTAPPHSAGSVQLSVTGGDGWPCSAPKHFDYVMAASPLALTGPPNGDDNVLQVQLVRILTGADKENVPSGELKWAEVEAFAQGGRVAPGVIQDHLLQHLLRQRLDSWLSVPDQKVSQTGSGGMALLHLAAGLGYLWAVTLLLSKGASVDMRDQHGRTSLHWAAANGREQVVVALLAAGAAPGLLARPCEGHPRGPTAADLAVANGHMGIAAFLAENVLNRSLSTMSLVELSESNRAAHSAEAAQLARAAANSPQWTAAHSSKDLQESMRAVRRAAEAAVKIQHAYRLHREVKAKGNSELALKGENLLSQQDKIDETGLSESQVLLIAATRKAHRTGRKPSNDSLVVRHNAAIQIQQRFRGWKNRRSFLRIRQRIVKLQASVRGNIARRQYRRMRWSVGILEKAILRWRRRRRGFRGMSNFSLPVPSTMPPVIGMPGLRNRDDINQAVGRVAAIANSEEAKAQYDRMHHASQTQNVVQPFEHQ